MFVRESSRLRPSMSSAQFLLGKGTIQDFSIQIHSTIQSSSMSTAHLIISSAPDHLRSRYVGRPQRLIEVRTRFAKAYKTAELFAGILEGDNSTWRQRPDSGWNREKTGCSFRRVLLRPDIPIDSLSSRSSGSFSRTHFVHWTA